MAVAADDTIQHRTRLEGYVDWLSQPQVVLALAAVFVVLLPVAAYIDGALSELADGFALRALLGYPALIVYTLAASRAIGRHQRRAVEAFRPLTTLPDAEFDKAVRDASRRSSGREWLAVAIGTAFGLYVVATSDWAMRAPAMRVYLIVSAAMMFGLLAWIIYGALASTNLFTQLHQLPLDIDIFDPAPLEPVARMSLSVSSALIGGTTLSIIIFFSSAQDLLQPVNILIYVILIVVAVVVFFLGMVNSHRVLLEVKERELQLVSRRLSELYQELKDCTAAGRLEGLETVSDAVGAWLTYRQVIEQTPEWPYTTGTLRRLLMSTLLPVAAWLAQLLVELST